MLSLKTDLPEDRIQVSRRRRNSFLSPKKQSQPLDSRHNYIMINFIIRENILLAFCCLLFVSKLSDRFFFYCLTLRSEIPLKEFTRQKDAAARGWMSVKRLWHIFHAACDGETWSLTIDIKDPKASQSLLIVFVLRLSLSVEIKTGIDEARSWKVSS